MSKLGFLDTIQLGESNAPVTNEILAGRYELLALVGSGGMGRVYRAFDQQLGDVVALKVIREDLAADPAVLARFVREARLARRVTHRNVARTFDIGEHGALRFLTMEYVDGVSLGTLVDARGGLTEARAVALCRAILEGLAAAHAVDVVHRDLKPDNVLVAGDGRVVLTDFGIARDASEAFQTAGRMMGTPAYMAPEQVEGALDPDARVDVYAFGEIAYELLTGVPAWPGQSFAEIVSARLLKEAPDPRRIRPVADAIANVVIRCMARRRVDRYADARATLTAWDAAMSGGDIVAVSSPLPSKVPVAATRATTSVAVLPIQNLGSADDGFLADGVTDDLIDALSMTPNLRVRPRGTVVRFSGREIDPREAGRALEVDAVVEGSLRRTPTGVRLSARLLGVADGFQLWARRFECPIGELLVASDEAARAVAEALASRLEAPERKAPTDGSAVETYLRARESLRRNWYAPSSTEALTLFREALDRAPDDPLVLAGFAIARARHVRSPSELAEARALAQRAITLAPHLGEPWIALATLHRHEREPQRQVAALARAIKAAPTQAEAHFQLGRILLEVGPLDRAVVALKLAATLDPRDDEIRAYVAYAHYALGETEAGDTILDPHARGGAHPKIRLACARMCLWTRSPEARLEASAASKGQVRHAYTELVGAALGGRPLSPATEVELARSIPRPELVELFLAELHFAGGDLENGIVHVTKSVEGGLGDAVWFDACPLLGEARRHPAWADLKARVAERADAVRVALRHEGFLAEEFAPQSTGV